MLFCFFLIPSLKLWVSINHDYVLNQRQAAQRSTGYKRIICYSYVTRLHWFYPLALSTACKTACSSPKLLLPLEVS